MTERQYRGESIERIAAHIASPEFRQTMAGVGVRLTGAEAAERLHAAAQHFDLAEFEALIALHRPKLWKRMNKRPSRLRQMLRWR